MRTLFVLSLLLLPVSVLAQTVDSPPALRTQVPIAYPERALSERLEADVLLLIDIDATGHVTKTEVLEPAQPSGYGFDEAVSDALLQFTFEPARAKGVAVPVRVQYRYRFVLPAEERAPTEAPVEAAVEPTPEATTTYQGPSGELGGTLLERGSRTTLVGVAVVVERAGEAFEAVTDEKGKFAFFDLPAGTWTLTIEHSGYLSAHSAELVVAKEHTELTLYLERSADNPYDVLVEAAAPKREVTRHRLSVKEVQTLPGTFGDPILAIENLPGVAVLPFDNTGIAMRGAAPDESQAYIDGFRVPMLYHFIGLRSVLAPGMLESIDVFPGGAPVSYGRQTGGVLDAHVKRIAPDRTHGYVDISMLDTGAYVETPLGKKVALAAAARASYIDKIMSAFGQPMPRYDDYQLQLVAHPSSAHTFRMLYLGSDDAFKLDTKDLRDQSAQVTFGNIEASAHMQHLAVEHDYAPSRMISNRLRMGYQHNQQRTHLGSDARIDFSFDAFMLRDAFRITPADWIAAELGVDANLGRWTTDVLVSQPPKEGEPQGYTDFEKERRRYNADIPHLAAGGWASLEIKPVKSLLIVPGLRSDLQPQVEQVTLDPRIMARYELIPQLAIKASSGVYHASPNIDESARRFGNPNLRAERSVQNSAGVEIKPIDSLELDLTGFYHQLDGLTVKSDKIITMGDRAVALNYQNTGEGRAYGLEVMLRKTLSHRLSGWVAYTLSRAERRRTSDDRYRLFDIDQTHNLVLVGAYQLPRHWQLSTRFRFRTGQPSTPIVGATFVSDTDEYAPAFGRTNSRRFSPFHQLDIRIDKKWVFNRWALTTYLDVQNVYNHKNAVSMAYNFDYSKSGKTTGVPLLTILGLKAEY
jgi:TonB family protein